MPRPKSAAPAYRFHVSGQAVVRLDSKDFYLGKHSTVESYARYYALLSEYNAKGRKAPATEDKDSQEAERLADTPILVKHVTADFRHRVLSRYEANEGQHNRYSNLLELLEQKHGEDEVGTFGPRKLEALRDGFLKRGVGKKDTGAVCRRYANELTRMVIRIINHGVARELVKPERIVALEALEPLRPGQAKDRAKRRGTVPEDVKATLPFLPATVAAMVRVQLGTAMRPSELFRMTPAMIDRSGPVWFYRPEQHKTQHRGKTRAAPILGDALEALTPYLFGDANGLCFKSELGTRWKKDSYRHHIVRACERNNLTKWTPYQLRHTALQRVRDLVGPEAAQALAGHANLQTTEIYAKAGEAKAIEAARACPRLG